MKKSNGEKAVMKILIISLVILSLLVLVNADNITGNLTIFPDAPKTTLDTTLDNQTFLDNVTTNVTIPVDNITTNITDTNITVTNVTDDTNITNVTLPVIVNNTNTTIINYTQINNDLNNTLNNLTQISNSTTVTTQGEPLNSTAGDNATCFLIDNFDTYNVTINGTVIQKNITLSINLCYNETTIYCDSEVATNLYFINITNPSCGGNGCQGSNVQKISNYYDISNMNAGNSTDPTIFVCWAKKKQDGYTMWTWKSLNLVQDPNSIYIFDFSNSSFLENNYNVTNTTVYNITNSIENNITNNITTNMTYVYNITNNIENNVSANLTSIENRLTALEEWRATVDSTLDYIIKIINTINGVLQNKVINYNFSGSTFQADNYNVTQATVNNVTNNVTNNIINNITSEVDQIYNITNNITNTVMPDNATLIDVQSRLTILEQWRITVDSTLNYILNVLNEISKKLNL